MAYDDEDEFDDGLGDSPVGFEEEVAAPSIEQRPGISGRITGGLDHLAAKREREIANLNKQAYTNPIFETDSGFTSEAPESTRFYGIGQPAGIAQPYEEKYTTPVQTRRANELTSMLPNIGGQRLTDRSIVEKRDSIFQSILKGAQGNLTQETLFDNPYWDTIRGNMDAETFDAFQKTAITAIKPLADKYIKGQQTLSEMERLSKNPTIALFLQPFLPEIKGNPTSTHALHVLNQAYEKYKILNDDPELGDTFEKVKKGAMAGNEQDAKTARALMLSPSARAFNSILGGWEKRQATTKVKREQLMEELDSKFDGIKGDDANLIYTMITKGIDSGQYDVAGKSELSKNVADLLAGPKQGKVGALYFNKVERDLEAQIDVKMAEGSARDELWITPDLKLISRFGHRGEDEYEKFKQGNIKMAFGDTKPGSKKIGDWVKLPSKSFLAEDGSSLFLKLPGTDTPVTFQDGDDTYVNRAALAKAGIKSDELFDNKGQPSAYHVPSEKKEWFSSNVKEFQPALMKVSDFLDSDKQQGQRILGASISSTANWVHQVNSQLKIGIDQYQAAEGPATWGGQVGDWIRNIVRPFASIAPNVGLAAARIEERGTQAVMSIADAIVGDKEGALDWYHALTNPTDLNPNIPHLGLKEIEAIVNPMMHPLGPGDIFGVLPTPQETEDQMQYQMNDPTAEGAWLYSNLKAQNDLEKLPLGMKLAAIGTMGIGGLVKIIALSRLGPGQAAGAITTELKLMSPWLAQSPKAARGIHDAILFPIIAYTEGEKDAKELLKQGAFGFAMGGAAATGGRLSLPRIGATATAMSAIIGMDAMDALSKGKTPTEFYTDMKSPEFAVNAITQALFMLLPGGKLPSMHTVVRPEKAPGSIKEHIESNAPAALAVGSVREIAARIKELEEKKSGEKPQTDSYPGGATIFTPDDAMKNMRDGAEAVSALVVDSDGMAQRTAKDLGYVKEGRRYVKKGGAKKGPPPLPTLSPNETAELDALRLASEIKAKEEVKRAEEELRASTDKLNSRTAASKEQELDSQDAQVHEELRRKHQDLEDKVKAKKKAADEEERNNKAWNEAAADVLNLIYNNKISGRAALDKGMDDPNFPTEVRDRVNSHIETENQGENRLIIKPAGLELAGIKSGKEAFDDYKRRLADIKPTEKTVATKPAEAVAEKPEQKPLSQFDAAEFGMWANKETTTVDQLKQLREDHEADPTRNSDHVIEILNDAIKKKSPKAKAPVAKPTEPPPLPAPVAEPEPSGPPPLPPTNTQKGTRAPFVLTPDKQRIPVTHDIVDASSIDASHNLDGSVNGNFYPLVNTNDYSLPKNQQSIKDMGQNLDADEMTDPTLKGSGGPPVVMAYTHVDPVTKAETTRYKVLSGNNRTLAAMLAYESHPEKGKALKDKLVMDANDLGVNPAKVINQPRPLQVRIISEELAKSMSAEDLNQLISNFNLSETKRPTSVDLAINNAEPVPVGEIFPEGVSTLSKLVGNAANVFRNLFSTKAISDKEATAMMEGKDRVNADGVKFVQNIAITKAFGKAAAKNIISAWEGIMRYTNKAGDDITTKTPEYIKAMIDGAAPTLARLRAVSPEMADSVAKYFTKVIEIATAKPESKQMNVLSDAMDQLELFESMDVQNATRMVGLAIERAMPTIQVGRGKAGAKGTGGGKTEIPDASILADHVSEAIKPALDAARGIEQEKASGPGLFGADERSAAKRIIDAFRKEGGIGMEEPKSPEEMKLEKDLEDALSYQKNIEASLSPGSTSPERGSAYAGVKSAEKAIEEYRAKKAVAQQSGGLMPAKKPQILGADSPEEHKAILNLAKKTIETIARLTGYRGTVQTVSAKDFAIMSGWRGKANRNDTTAIASPASQEVFFNQIYLDKVFQRASELMNKSEISDEDMSYLANHIAQVGAHEIVHNVLPQRVGGRGSKGMNDLIAMVESINPEFRKRFIKEVSNHSDPDNVKYLSGDLEFIKAKFPGIDHDVARWYAAGEFMAELGRAIINKRMALGDVPVTMQPIMARIVGRILQFMEGVKNYAKEMTGRNNDQKAFDNLYKSLEGALLDSTDIQAQMFAMPADIQMKPGESEPIMDLEEYRFWKSELKGIAERNGRPDLLAEFKKIAAEKGYDQVSKILRDAVVGFRDKGGFAAEAFFGPGIFKEPGGPMLQGGPQDEMFTDKESLERIRKSSIDALSKKRIMVEPKPEEELGELFADAVSKVRKLSEMKNQKTLFGQQSAPNALIEGLEENRKQGKIREDYAKALEGMSKEDIAVATGVINALMPRMVKYAKRKFGLQESDMFSSHIPQIDIIRSWKKLTENLGKEGMASMVDLAYSFDSILKDVANSKKFLEAELGIKIAKRGLDDLFDPRKIMEHRAEMGEVEETGSPDFVKAIEMDDLRNKVSTLRAAADPSFRLLHEVSRRFAIKHDAEFKSIFDKWGRSYVSNRKKLFMSRERFEPTAPIAYTDAGVEKNGPWEQPNGKWKARVYIKNGGFFDRTEGDNVTQKEFIGASADQAMERARAWQDEYNEKFIRTHESLEGMQEATGREEGAADESARDFGEMDPSEEGTEGTGSLPGERVAPEDPENTIIRSSAEKHVTNYLITHLTRENMDAYTTLRGLFAVQGESADLIEGSKNFEDMKKLFEPIIRELVVHRQIHPGKAMGMIGNSIENAWSDLLRKQAKLSAAAISEMDIGALERSMEWDPTKAKKSDVMQDLISNLESIVKNNRSRENSRQRSKQIEMNLKEQEDGGCVIHFDPKFK